MMNTAIENAIEALELINHAYSNPNLSHDEALTAIGSALRQGMDNLRSAKDGWQKETVSGFIASLHQVLMPLNLVMKETMDELIEETPNIVGMPVYIDHEYRVYPKPMEGCKIFKLVEINPPTTNANEEKA